MGVPVTTTEARPPRVEDWWPPKPAPDDRGVWCEARTNHYTPDGLPIIYPAEVRPVAGLVTFAVNDFRSGFPDFVTCEVGGTPVPIPHTPGWEIAVPAVAGERWVLVSIRRAE
jgi:hypothetical protein